METMDRQLRYFICIAELGSCPRGRRAGPDPSGLSRQLAALEARIGQPLFLRTGRGVELTEAGKLLYDATQPAYRGIDLAVERMRHQGVTQGTLRLAAVHTLSYYYTADLVAGFVSAHPSVNLSIMGRSSPEVVALVESGKADLGLVYDSAVDSGTLESCPCSTTTWRSSCATTVRCPARRTWPRCRCGWSASRRTTRCAA